MKLYATLTLEHEKNSRSSVCARLLRILLLHDELQEALHALLLLLHTLEPHVALCVHLLQVADPAQHTRLEVNQPILRAAHTTV